MAGPDSPPVGKQQILIEGDGGLFLAGADAHRQGNTGQVGVGCPILPRKAQGHQTRTLGNDGQTKLLGNAVAKVGGTNFGNGQAARGHDQVVCLHQALAGVQAVAAGA